MRDDAFLLTIEDKHWVPEAGPVFVGYVQRGTAQAGDLIEILGPPEVLTVPVTNIDRPDQPRVIAQPDQLVAILLDNITREQFESEIEVGHIIAQADSIEPRTRFQADVWVLEESKGGRADGLRADLESISLHAYGLKVMCRRVTFQSDSGVLIPGQYASVLFETFPMPVEVGLPFMVRVGARWVARGIVTAV